MSSAERFVRLRNHLGLNQAVMAEKAGVKRDSWRRYESGDLPNGETLERIAEMGISIDWLLSGRGEMLAHLPQAELAATTAPADRAPTDPALLGRIIDAVIRIYRDEGQQLAPINQGEIVGLLYDRLAPIEDEAERRGALRYAAEQLRADLRRAAAEPATNSKHRA